MPSTRGRSPWRLLAIAAIVTLTIAASLYVWRVPLERTARRLLPLSPHQRYAASLEDAGLGSTALVQQWRAAAAEALATPTALTLPFREHTYVDPARPSARGYAFDLRRGQRLEVRVTRDEDPAARVFLDLFESGGGATSTPIAAVEVPEMLRHEAARDGRVILRAQPELLRGGRFEISATVAPTLAFPVEGAGADAIWSVFGDSRDAGRRRHEGIDIFAPRGTPVLAASAGIVTGVGENRLGGRVVWVWDPARGQTLYYAHLEEQRVRAGQRVDAGDEIGTVGNTGNARTTAPHLHLGIYRRGEGAIDPDPFVRPAPPPPASPDLSADALGSVARTRSTTITRTAPRADAASVTRLPPLVPLRVEGAIGSWARARLPLGTPAFVDARSLDTRTTPLGAQRFETPTVLRTAPATPALSRTLVEPGVALDVLGRFREAVLVRAPDGTVGWAEPLPVDAAGGP